MPNPISITPAEISRFFVGKFLSLPPKLKPNKEFIKVINVINKAGLRMRFPYKESEIPAEKASILVAIPISNRHIKPMQEGLLSLESKASLINLIPKKTNIVKTIKLA